MFVFAAVYCLRSTGVMHDFCRWTNDKRVLGDDRQQRGPLRAQSGYLGRTADNICVYPDFVLSGEVRMVTEERNSYIFVIAETHSLVAAQIFPTAQIFLELKFILGIQDEP